ncbi:MAG: Vms1/Ankzf1 family peptidyl-tRNA hydrolase [Elusimicrobiota bacterium]
MFHAMDLRRLAKLSGPDRVFLSAYVSREDGRRWLGKECSRLRGLLAGAGEEREHFDENVRLLEAYLRERGLRGTGLCLFVCWALDLVEGCEIPAPERSSLVLDSSPYLRPLAELQDEYETFAVVAADNSRARIRLVASAKATDETRVRGNIKNHVRVGGWSQQRYERRRDKQVLHYAKEIGRRLLELDKTERFRRVVLVGSKEAVTAIRRNLPAGIAKKAVSGKALHLGKGQDWVDREVFRLFFEDERRSERDLWARIRDELLRGGLAAVGPEEVRKAAASGRVQTMIVSRRLRLPGVRCRKCEGLAQGTPGKCPACGGGVFEVDFVNELVELVAAAGGETDFADPLPGLRNAGGVAALLRY